MVAAVLRSSEAPDCAVIRMHRRRKSILMPMTRDFSRWDEDLMMMAA